MSGRNTEDILNDYRTVMNNLYQKIFFKNTDSTYILCNTVFANDRGIRAEDIEGKSDYDFFPRDLAEKYRADDKRIMDNNTEEDIEESYIIEGKKTWVRTVKKPIQDDKGKVMGLLGSFWEVPERRYETDKIKELVFDTATDGIAVVDMDQKNFVMANPTFLRMTGYSSEDLQAASFLDLHPEDEKNWIIKELDRIIKKEITNLQNIPIKRKDGSIFYADIKATFTTFTDKNWIIKFFRDVSDRIRAEEIITAQAKDILSLSTPVIQIWEGVVVAPLIGTMDSARTEQMMKSLLSEIVRTSSTVAILDITGVPTVDTQTARHLYETIMAIRLIGAQVIITGVRPAIAQIMVHLGIDLSSVITKSSLRQGLQFAFQTLGLHISEILSLKE